MPALPPPASLPPLLADRVGAVLDVPLHRFLGIQLVDPGRPEAGIALRASPPSLNNVGVVHGGVLTSLLDVAAYLAVLPHLSPDENAVTHDATASIMRPVRAGATVHLRGRVSRLGRSLIFAGAEALVDDAVVATGTVTKSRVALTG